MESNSMTGDGRAAIEKEIIVVDSDIFKDISDDMIVDVFELQRCLDWIKEKDYKKICIQLPDEYLRYAPKVVELLSSTPGTRVFVLADSTYGSCCVDEKTAQHVPDADCVIHFGPSCLSSTSGRIPVLYIFTRPPINLESLQSAFEQNFQPEETVIIAFDVIYQFAVGNLLERIKNKFPHVQTTSLVVPSNSKDEASLQASNPTIIKHGRVFPCVSKKELEESTIFFVGQRALPNLLLALPSNTFKVFDPALTSESSVSVQTATINRLIRKRSYYIEKLKDAGSVGILVGTLVVQNYLNLIDRLKEILRKAGKTYYIVSIGEINPCKLGNFMDINCFVFVGCPEVVNYYISDESKGQFFQPILTPYDVELAFCEDVTDQWGQGYVIDWSFLIQAGKPKVKSLEEDVSLITGAMRSVAATDLSSEKESGVVNWRGLNENEETVNDPNLVYMGRSGIASSYADEPLNQL